MTWYSSILLLFTNYYLNIGEATDLMDLVYTKTKQINIIINNKDAFPWLLIAPNFINESKKFIKSEFNIYNIQPLYSDISKKTKCAR